MEKLPAVSIDHLGLSEEGLPHLLKLVDKGIRVKATGFGRVELNVANALKSIYQVNPDAIMFGTDLPSTRAKRPFSYADIDDLHRIVQMLADDELGMTRERYENPLPESYLKAFAAIESDPNNELIVGCIGEAIVGVLQITFTPYLTHQGSWRAITDKKRDDSLRFYERLGFKVTHEGLKMKL